MDFDLDELLEELLAGVRTEDEDDVKRAFQQHPEIAQRWSRLRGISARLDGAGAAQRKSIEASEEFHQAPGQDRVAPTLESLVEAESVAGKHRERFQASSSSWATWKLASAALLLISLGFLAARFLGSDQGSEPSNVGGSGPDVAQAEGPENTDEPEPRFLGPGEFELIQPIGSQGTRDLFEWNGKLPEHGFFQVLIYNAEDDDLLAEPIDRSPRLEENRWEPDPTKTASWPERVHWQLTVYMADGSEFAVLDTRF